MYQFEIITYPIPEKYKELYQTLTSLIGLLEDHECVLKIHEKNSKLLISGNIDNINRMQNIFESEEFEILSGAISILAEKSEFRIKNSKEIFPLNQMKKFVLNHNL
jgi:hypothetical protein